MYNMMFWYTHALWNDDRNPANDHIVHLTWLPFVVRTFKVYTLSKLQIPGTVLVTS